MKRKAKRVAHLLAVIDDGTVVKKFGVSSLDETHVRAVAQSVAISEHEFNALGLKPQPFTIDCREVDNARQKERNLAFLARTTLARLKEKPSAIERAAFDACA